MSGILTLLVIGINYIGSLQAAMFRFVILTCFLAGGKFDHYLHNATVMSIHIIY
jgi:hypothetical protein